jgi:hypothetical protein
MPVLDCSVTSCVYNKSDCCCRGDIKVEGRMASEAGETCCSSFRERREDDYTSERMEPDTALHVDCEATRCIYNDDCKCGADHIGIAGSNACRCEQTECASFDCSCK